MTHASFPPGQVALRRRSHRAEAKAQVASCGAAGARAAVEALPGPRGAPSSMLVLQAPMSAKSCGADLRRAVMASLVSEPCLKTRHVGVAVQGAVVTLSGYVTSAAQKDAAGVAARRVSGVEAVTDQLVVALPCAETGPVARKGAEVRETLTLSGGPARAAAAPARMPGDAQVEDRS